MAASTAADVLVRPGPNTGLALTIGISALLHVLTIAVLISLPRGSTLVTPPIASYTVDLVAPGTVGGTNLKQGPGGLPKAPAPVVPMPAKVSGPPAPKAEAVPPAALPPAQESEKVTNKAADRKEAPPIQAKAAARTAVEPAKPAPAKPPPPKAEAVKAAEKAPPPKPVADAAEKAQLAKVAPAKPAAPQSKAKPAQEVAKTRSAPEKPFGQAAKPKDETDAKIAAAVATRARQLESKSSAAPASAAGDDLDSRIAAAVRRRVAEQVGVGKGDVEGRGDGGPISVGPGVGPGGTPMSLEYIAYRSQMEARIKEAWAWAGADRSLVAVVAFNITPSGEIVNVRTAIPSGDSSYDASAERAVRKASPLGPPPEKYREEFWSVELEFRPEDSRS